MKIQGPSSNSAVSAGKRKTTSGASSQGFSVDTGSPAGRTASTGAAGATSAVQSVDAILALQGVEDATQARKKATERAMRRSFAADGQPSPAADRDGVPLQATQRHLAPRGRGVHADAQTRMDYIKKSSGR